MLAGYSTTSNAMTSCLFRLARHPEVQEKIYDLIMSKMDQYVYFNNLWISAIVIQLLNDSNAGRCLSWNDPRHSICWSSHERSDENASRSTLVIHILFFRFKSHYFLTSAFSLERRCNKDITYNGIHIKKDMMIQVSVQTLHYSEKYYAEPETFNPDRYLHNWTICDPNIVLIYICWYAAHLDGVQRIRQTWIHMLSCHSDLVLVIVSLCALHRNKWSCFYAFLSNNSISSQLKRRR